MLKEECRLRVFENRVLRRIFGRKRDEVTGEWRRLHNEELYALYSSPNIMFLFFMNNVLKCIFFIDLDSCDVFWSKETEVSPDM
jgi:hypothetical protein